VAIQEDVTMKHTPLALAAAALLSLSAIAATQAQPPDSSSISGKTVDARTQAPLMGVKVAAYPDARTPSSKMIAVTMTHKDGSFRLDGLSAAQYQLELSKAGYEVQILSGLSVRSNERAVIGEPVALGRASAEYAAQMACNNLVRPEETASVYIVCAGK
jgi:hypothetical protein